MGIVALLVLIWYFVFTPWKSTTKLNGYDAKTETWKCNDGRKRKGSFFKSPVYVYRDELSECKDSYCENGFGGWITKDKHGNIDMVTKRKAIKRLENQIINYDCNDNKFRFYKYVGGGLSDIDGKIYYDPLKVFSFNDIYPFESHNLQKYDGILYTIRTIKYDKIELAFYMNIATGKLFKPTERQLEFEEEIRMEGGRYITKQEFDNIIEEFNNEQDKRYEETLKICGYKFANRRDIMREYYGKPLGIIKNSNYKYNGGTIIDIMENLDEKDKLINYDLFTTYTGMSHSQRLVWEKKRNKLYKERGVQIYERTY